MNAVKCIFMHVCISNLVLCLCILCDCVHMLRFHVFIFHSLSFSFSFILSICMAYIHIYEMRLLHHCTKKKAFAFNEEKFKQISLAQITKTKWRENGFKRSRSCIRKFHIPWRRLKGLNKRYLQHLNKQPIDLGILNISKNMTPKCTGLVNVGCCFCCRSDISEWKREKTKRTKNDAKCKMSVWIVLLYYHSTAN